jgi:hypothetical protein
LGDLVESRVITVRAVLLVRLLHMQPTTTPNFLPNTPMLKTSAGLDQSSTAGEPEKWQFSLSWLHL